MNRSLLPLLLLLLTTTFALARGPVDDSPKGKKPKQIQVPFTMDRNLIIVEARLNGQDPSKFILDTGTEGLVLSEAIATQLDLKGEGYTDVGRPNDPNPAKARNIEQPSLEMNGFAATQVAGVAIAETDIFLPPGVAGILSLSLFQGYLVTIDYAQSQLVLRQGALSAGKAGVIPVDLTSTVEGKIIVNGVEMPAHFDSGGPEALTFPYEWQALLPLKGWPMRYARARTGNGEVDLYKAQLIGKIQIGSIVLTNPDITLVSGGFSTVNIGYPFLKNYAVTFDRQNGLMQLTPNKKPKE